MTIQETPIEYINNPSIKDKVKYPGEWWNEKENNKRKKELKRVNKKMKDADIISISDTDIDGLGCMAILEEANPDKKIARIPGGHRTDLSVVKLLKIARNQARKNVEIYITDIHPDSNDLKEIKNILDQWPEYIGENTFEDLNVKIYFYDHHQWTDEELELVSDYNTDIRVEEDICASSIVFENNNFPDEKEQIMKELAEVTCDHDIWIKEDSRSDDLSDFKQIIEDYNKYIDTIKEYGGNIIKHENIAEKLEKYRTERNKKIEYSAKKSNWYKLIVNEKETTILSENEKINKNILTTNYEKIIIAVAYGSAYTSGLGNVLYEGWEDYQENYEELLPDISYNSTKYRPGDADIAIMIKPWNKISFRSNSKYPICDYLGRLFNGGGHNKAAGGQIDLIGEKITYGKHWETNGKNARKHIINTIENNITYNKLTELIE